MQLYESLSLATQVAIERIGVDIMAPMKFKQSMPHVTDRVVVRQVADEVPTGTKRRLRQYG